MQQYFIRVWLPLRADRKRNPIEACIRFRQQAATINILQYEFSNVDALAGRRFGRKPAA